MPVDTGYENFVAYKWSRPNTPTSDKRIRTNLTNVSSLGNIFNVMDTAEAKSEVFPEKDKEGDNGKVAPEKYSKFV